MSAKDERTVRRSILEIRFEPRPDFFDKRGALLKELFGDPGGTRNFKHWKLNDKRVDLFDPDSDKILFVSFHNAGYVIEYQPTDNYFREQVAKYFKVILKDLGVHTLTRVGVRTGVAREVRDFDETMKRIVKALYRSEDHRFKKLTGELVDVQAIPFISKDGGNSVVIQCGAMRREEYEEKSLFNKIDDLPEKSFWIDVDYSSGDMALGSDPHAALMKFVDLAEARIREKQELLNEMVFGEVKR